MKSRGKTSLAASSVVTGSFGKRPEPPDGLTERQVEIWRAIVASEDPNFFNTEALRRLLVDYCRHSESAEKLSDIIETVQTYSLMDNKSLARYNLLVRTRDVETRASTMFATKLRLTNQSRYTPHGAEGAARRALKGARPWEIEA